MDDIRRRVSAKNFKKKKEVKRIKPLPFSNVGIGEEKDYFIENLALLVESGRDVFASLESIKSELRTGRMKKAISQIQSDVEEGKPLWQALKDVYLFPDYVISLVRVGEQSGHLSENLKVVVEQQEKRRSLRSKIRSAMAYPILLLVVALVVGLGIAWFILPKLTTMFTQLDVSLPAPTRALIAAGDFLENYGSIVIPAFLAVLFIALYFIFFFKKTKSVGQAFLFKLPGIKKLMREVELARFGYILGSLLNAGLPVIDALDSLRGITDFAAYRKFYSFLYEKIRDGHSFKDSFSLYKGAKKLVPAPIQQMVVSGEQSGNLPGTLEKIGKIFEEKTDVTSKNLTVVLEPILLVIVWLGVVLVALAVIMPIYSLIGGFNS